MRSDARFSKKRVYLPNSSNIGFSRLYAKPGDFVIWKEREGQERQGRVVATVDVQYAITDNGMAPIKGWLMIMVLSDTHSDLWVRWVPPDEITACYLSGDWIERSKKVLDYFMMAHEVWSKASKDPYAIAKVWGQ